MPGPAPRAPEPALPLAPRRPLRALAAAARRDPWLAVGLVVCSAALVWPLWVSPLLPMMDLPQHLATIRVLHSLPDPAWGLEPYYVVDLSSTQYLSYYFAVDALGYLVDLETANRLVLSAYVAGLVLAMAAYLRAFGRDPAVALLAAPLAWNTFLVMGFANYVTAIPLVFWALALLRRLMDDLRWPRFALLTAVTVLLFYSHAHAFLVYLLAAGLTGLLAGRGLHPRHWGRQALHLVPTAALMGLWIARSAILAGDEAWREGHGGRNVSPTDVRFEPILDRLAALPRQLLDVWRDDSDEKLLLALLALATFLLLFRRFPPPEDELAELGPRRAWLRARTPDVLAVAVFAAYVASPISYKWIWPISHRMVPVVALFALGALAWRRLPWRPVLLVLPAMALSIAAGRVHAEHARAFAEEAGHVRELLARTEPGRRLTALIYDRGSAVMNHAPYLHFGQYYVLDRGGVASFSFVDFPQSPVRYRAETAPPRLPNRWEWTPERYRYPEHGAWYDYTLIRDGGPGRERDPFTRYRDEVELVARDGQWALYRRRDLHPRPAVAGSPDAAPAP